ncbi:MAG: response regulator, partial [Cyanobacteria bacterium P01_A01_bin.40]
PHKSLGDVLGEISRHVEGLKSIEYKDNFDKVVTLPVEKVQYTTSIEDRVNIFLLLGYVEIPSGLIPGTPIYRGEKTAPKHFLVIDDANQEFISDNFADLRYLADFAKSEAEAIEFLENQSYDAILIDLDMPQINGFELVRKLRSLNHIAGIKEIPIIIKSSKRNFPQHDLHLSNINYWTRPFTAKKLNSVVKKSML